GRNGLRRMVYGSVAESVINRVDVPVVLLGPAYPGGDVTDIRQIIVCVDGSATSQAVLPLAAMWSRALQKPCTLLHINTKGSREMSGSDFMSLARLLQRTAPQVDVVRHDARDVPSGVLDMIRPSSRSLAVMA